MLLGKRIKEFRIQKNLTQEELGRLINITKVSICCYENGTRIPSLETIVALANAFEVSLDDLLGREKEESWKIKNIGLVFGLSLYIINGLSIIN